MQVADHPIMTAAAGGAAYCAYKRRQNRQKIDVDEMLEVGVRAGGVALAGYGLYKLAKHLYKEDQRKKYGYY